MPQAHHATLAVEPQHRLSYLLALALSISLGVALSLGLARFAYGLLLPDMRSDLGWSYALAGALNTSNASGYLLGALSAAWLLKHCPATRLFLWGALLSCVWLGLSGFARETMLWMVLRALSGVSSAWVFLSGGILAARLAARAPAHSGLLIGLYYAGAGFGIALSALLLPQVMQQAAQGAIDGLHTHYAPWAYGWWVLALLSIVCTLCMRWPARVMQPWFAATPASAASAQHPSAPTRLYTWQHLTPALLAYSCFGMGYIGYMTFIIALLKEHGASADAITFFYTVLGLACAVSAPIWARLLRRQDGRPLAVLNALLGAATWLAAISHNWTWLLLSGLVFGACFLQAVASTTVLVRHQWPAHLWPRGIALFTIIFALGQIIGPTLVGWIADGQGGLQSGLMLSAAILWAGALCAVLQKPPPHSHQI